MTRLLMLVEGQSEEIFVKQTLAPHLAEHGVYVEPILLWTKRLASGGGFRGGTSNWNQIRKNLFPLTRDGNAWVTTLLDFYGLPEDVPGYQEAMQPGNPRDRVTGLEARLAAEINHQRFIPFLALHEFEAWVFSKADVLAKHFDRADLTERVAKAIAVAGEPELINHGKDTHPKARLQAMATGYKETSDGPTLMGKIGIPAIRDACPHFAAWLGRLEALGQGA
ncbi:MAG: DUF4276 family protein [Betaproteobacteria bacterium]